jgi:hypothetical protein
MKIMKRLLLLSSIAIAVVACEKDKFETKPKLEIVSLNSEFIAVNQDLTATLRFTDKEGDIDDSLYVVRTRINQRGPLTPQRPNRYKVPEFPNQQEGEINVTFIYRDDLTNGFSTIAIPGTPNKENDTLLLKFVLLDKKKNTSDTATTTVVVERN